MIEQKLVVGRYIDLVLPIPTFVGLAAPGFQEQNPLLLHIEESEYSAAPFTPGTFPVGHTPSLKQKAQMGLQNTGNQIKSKLDLQRTSALAGGHVAKTHRNFAWLAWVPGTVNEVRPNGMDVLTGPMSGCWITSYVRGGVHYVGHVGTEDDPTTANSIAAKGGWNTWAASVPMGSYSGYKPTADWAGPMPALQPGETRNKTFALVTQTGDFHIVVGYQVGASTRIRIAGIQKTRSSLPANGRIP
jgi:hypothetical protein